MLDSPWSSIIDRRTANIFYSAPRIRMVIGLGIISGVAFVALFWALGMHYLATVGLVPLLLALWVRWLAWHRFFGLVLLTSEAGLELQESRTNSRLRVTWSEIQGLTRERRRWFTHPVVSVSFPPHPTDPLEGETDVRSAPDAPGRRKLIGLNLSLFYPGNDLGALGATLGRKRPDLRV